VRVGDERAFFAFCKRLFQQRRKQTLTILRGMFPRSPRGLLSERLRRAQVPPQARPEQLPLATLARLYRGFSTEATP